MQFFRTITAALMLGALALYVPASAQPMPPPPVEYYGDLPGIEEVIVSPSGTYVALLQSSGGERVISILDAAGSPVKQLAVGEAKVRSIEWVGEQAILLIRSETGRLPRQYLQSKAEFLRGNVIPLDDRSPVVSIFAQQRSIANAIAGLYGVRRVDGRWMGYFGGFRMGATSGDRNRLLDGQPALFAVDLLTGEADLADYAGDWPALRRWLVTDNGEVGARLELATDTGEWSIRNGSGRTIARGQSDQGEVSLTGFDANGASVIYSTYDENAGFTRRFSVPLEGGEPQEVWTQIGLQRFIFEPFSARILGVKLEGDVVELSDPAKQQRLADALAAFSFASSSRIVDWTADFGTIIAKTSGNYDSGTWFRINGATGERGIIGLEYPAIQGPVIGKVSTFGYSAQDGLEIEGILTLPPGREATALPVIIFPHGGPTAHDIERFDWWAQAFAARGYAVFQPNFRGSTGRGRSFVDAGDGEWGRKMQSDLSDGLSALAEQGIVDPDRACIMGASYGGYAALAGVTLQNGLYRCAVSVNGVSDVEQLYLEERTWRPSVINRSLDRLFGAGANLDALSPARRAGRADAPVLLIHGRDDTVVPFSHSAKMADGLRDAGKPVEFIELEGEDHYLSNSATRKRMLQATVDFIERHNPPG